MKSKLFHPQISGANGLINRASLQKAVVAAIVVCLVIVVFALARTSLASQVSHSVQAAPPLPSYSQPHVDYCGSGWVYQNGYGDLTVDPATSSQYMVGLPSPQE